MEIAAVEQRKPVRETPAQKLAREFSQFVAGLTRLAVLTVILLPFIILATLTIDIPVQRFDRLFDAASLKPSLWMSVGGLILTLALPAVILIGRRFGGDEAARAVTAAWGVAAAAAFIEVSNLAPELTEKDFPIRFIVAFVGSAMLGQFVAIGVYDVTRGGGRWWRAPLFAALFGFAVQTAFYFPVAFWGMAQPWGVWALADFIVKAAAAFAFLGAYFLLQKPLKPRGGYGG